MAAAAIVAAALYWRWRRLTETGFGVLVAASLVVTTVVLAVPAYVSCTGGQTQFWAPVTWTLSLFLGSAEDVCGPTKPLALQVARLTAILTTFLSLGAVGLTALVSQRDGLRARFARSVVLVVGLDDLTRRFIEILTHHDLDGSTVVLLEPTRGNPFVGELRRRGVRAVYGDPTDPEQIRRLLVGRGPLGHRHRLCAAYILTPEASETLTIAGHVRSVVGDLATDAASPRLVARFDDPRHAEAWRRRQIADDHELLTDTVGLFRVTAQEVVDEALGHDPRRLVVLGSTPMAVAVLEELVQHRREQAVDGTPPDLEVVVIAPDAEELLIDHVRGQEWYGDRIDGGERPTPVAAVPAVASVAAALDTELPALVVVATEPSEDQGQLTSRLALRYPNVPFLAWHDGVQGIAAGNVLENVTTFGLTLVATHRTGERTVEVLPEDGWERIARRLHEQYVATRSPGDGPPGPGQLPWDDLSRFYRESNRRRVAVALQIVMRAGRTWLPPSRGSRVPARLGSDEVRDLAHLEHESWWRYYLAGGFRPGPRREVPNRTLRHPGLVPWEDLPDRDRAYTVASLEHCLKHLEAMGYIPFESHSRDSGRRYRRSGSVAARRLDASWAWGTESGAEMSAQPGDWRVSDADGNAWSVTDTDFRRTYEHVQGETYRRTGVVSARATRAGEQVVSTEGIETARAGDWVVEDDAGKQWIVPAARFAASYALDDDASAS
ncbi:RyR domain-containing protein [Patulibacter minatonensis]|uniref:RyR domain-containing protein n=1 Tax=Patulibacter minatonensis TaxID=298163 RepID=UPI00047CB172|nr:RyR domain-containing protein [Patulibacter minatonensis]